MIKRILIAGVALVLASNVAMAQDAARERRLAAIANASTRATIRAIGDSARAAGISDESILLLSLQGLNMAKAPADSVIKAARVQLGYLRTAATIVSASASADLKVTVDALKANIEPDVLRRVAKQKGETSLVVRFSVMTDLVGNSKVPTGIAESAVTRLAVAGADDLYLTDFRQAVESDIALRGQVPTAAVTTRVNSAITTDATGGTTLVNGPATRATGRIRIPPEN